MLVGFVEKFAEFEYSSDKVTRKSALASMQGY